MSGYNFGTTGTTGTAKAMDPTLTGVLFGAFAPPAPPAPPAQGDKVRVILEGVVVNDDIDHLYLGYDSTSGTDLYVCDRRIMSVVVTEKQAPAWQAGDVVVLQHSRGAREFTYVRGQKLWPGEYGDPKYDTTVSTLYRQGLVRHVLRDGKPVQPLKPVKG